jgi:RNA polymerase sigma-70 factor (ECF subfamily)
VDDRRQRFETEALIHFKAVFNAACRLSRDRDRARDLAQEAMLRAYRTFDAFVPGTNARAWLLTIVYSVFVNQYHRQRREPAQISMEALEARHQRYLADPGAHLAASTENWSEPEVEAAVAELPEAFRGALLLVDVEELTYEEAATALGVPVGTVRSRLFRARRLLAAALQDFAIRRGLVRQEVDPS